MPKEAKYYKSQEGLVICSLCPHHCRLKPGQTGICRVRRNEEGLLHTLNYGMTTALALDPIEKKPLYHFYPGKNILSAGTFGCNLACGFCQNHNIAHVISQGEYISPQKMADITYQAVEQNSIGLAFTYNEPTIWYEYILATAKPLKEKGLQVVLVTNGFIEGKPLEELLTWADAFNIDLKAFNERFYRRNCKAKLEPIKKTIAKAAEQAHIEITTLIIPRENDSENELKELAKWVASLSPNIPLHLSRYHPAYKFVTEPTPIKTMHRAYEIAREHLHFVYMGNMPGFENDTKCLNCETVLISRTNYRISLEALEGTVCRNCGAEIRYVVN